VNAPGKGTSWVFSRTRSKAALYSYLSEVEPVEFAVTNNGYLSTLHPDGTQKIYINRRTEKYCTFESGD